MHLCLGLVVSIHICQEDQKKDSHPTGGHRRLNGRVGSLVYSSGAYYGANESLSEPEEACVRARLCFRDGCVVVASVLHFVSSLI